MIFPIDPSQVRFQASGLPQFEGDAESARHLLERMAVSLTSGGAVKPGYLSVVQSPEGGALQVGLRRWRGANASTEQATALVKDLVAKAYGDQPAVRQALEAYLQQSGNRVGTQSFMRLVQSLDSARAGASLEQPSAASVQLRAVQVKRGARLRPDGFEASATLRQKVDQTITGVTQALVQAHAKADLLGALEQLQREQVVLMEAIENADAAGMRTQDLQATLRELVAQIVELEPHVQLVKVLATDPQAQIERRVQAGLAEQQATHDSALRHLQDKAAALNDASVSFYAFSPAEVDMAAASEHHSQLLQELQEARASALKAGEELHAKTLELLADMSQWQAAVAAQPRQGFVDPGTQFERTLQGLRKKADMALQETRAQIAGHADVMGPPDPVLMGHLAQGRWPQAYERLRDLHGPGAAAAMGQLARRLCGPGTGPTALAEFAAQAFVADPACGQELARWISEHLDLPGSTEASQVQLRQALDRLAQLNPVLAREAILALNGLIPCKTSLAALPGAGAHVHLKLVASDRAGTVPQTIFSLEASDLRDRVLTVEGYRVALRGAQLAGTQLVFVPVSPYSGNDKGVDFDLSAAASLPARVHLDFSQALARARGFRAAGPFTGNVVAWEMIANNDELAVAEQRESGLLRMVERLPADRADLKVSMMRDILEFFGEARLTGHRGAWEPTVAALLGDPVYLADPSIRQMLHRPPLDKAWGRSLMRETLTTRLSVAQAVDHIESATEAGMATLMREGAQMFNQLFVFAEGLQDGDSLKQRIATLEERYLNTPPRREMMAVLAEVTDASYQTANGHWKFRPGLEYRLLTRKDVLVYTSAENFRRAVAAPAHVNWPGFFYMHEASLEQGGALQISADGVRKARLSELLQAFPLLQRAYDTLPADGASDVVEMIFSGEEAAGLREQLMNSLRLSKPASSPGELSLELSPYLQPLMRFDDARTGDAPSGITRAHYLQLLQHAASLGFGSDTTSFARYLQCLSASFAFLSSEGALGNGLESVHVLRMYALALHRESMHLGQMEPAAFRGHEQQMPQIDARFTQFGECAHVLAVEQADMVKKLNPKLAATVMPARLVGDDLAQVVDANDTQALAQEEARNAALVRELRALEGGESSGEVRAPMQFAQGALIHADDGAAFSGPDFSQPDFLVTELTARLDELGTAPQRLRAQDPITRLLAAATVQGRLRPLAAALEAGPARVDAQLAQALQALDAERSGIESEQPAQGASQIDRVRFERDRQFRLDAMSERVEAARAKADRQRLALHSAWGLFQASAAVLAQVPGQA